MTERRPMHTIPTREFAQRDLGRLADMCESIAVWLSDVAKHASDDHERDELRKLARAMAQTRRYSSYIAERLGTPELWDWPDEAL